MVIEIRCAWCGRPMGSKECECSCLKDTPITHSICPACKQRLLDEAREFQPPSIKDKKGEDHD